MSSAHPTAIVWQRIARDLAEKIRTGDIPVEAKIPSYKQLRGQYGAAHGTVRQALAYLQDVGVLRGRQGAGVFVVRIPDDRDLAFDGEGLETAVAALQVEMTELRERLALVELRLRVLQPEAPLGGVPASPE